MGIPVVGQYMTPSPITIQRRATVFEAQQTLRENGIRHLPVLDGEALVGIVSDRDLQFIESFAKTDPRTLTVGAAMTPRPYTVSPAAALDRVLDEMAAHRYGSALVVDEGRVVGIFTTVDALSACARLLRGAAGA